MSVEEYLTPGAVILDVRACCKREALMLLAKHAAELMPVDADTLRDQLLEREKLGSTAVGDGVAIPHTKVAGLPQVMALVARLERPVDFDAMDNQDVDLCVLLLAPENATAAHLKALSKVARLLRDDSVRDALRNAESVETAYAIVTRAGKSNAA